MPIRTFVAPFTVAVLAVATAQTQSCVRVADLAAGTAPSSPNAFVCCFGDQLFFSASDAIVGQKPWTSRGGGPPIRLSSVATFPRDFTPCGNGLVVFSAEDGTNGRELWVTDGTPDGATLLANIRPGSLSSSPEDLVALGDRVLFTAEDGTNGRELWATNGTSGGTVLVKDVRPGPLGSDAADLVTLGSSVVFAANDGTNGTEPWTTDGTTANTQLLVNVNAGALSSAASGFTLHDGAVYFSARGPAGIEPYVTDGSAGGTQLLADVNPNGDSRPTSFTSCGRALFFVAAGNVTGFELFVHDAAGGTRITRDIRGGGSSASPRELACCGDGIVMFSANDGVAGFEPWISDGTAAGTQLVLDVNVGSFSSSPTDLTCVGDRAYFQANDGSVTGLWTSDGTGGGTTRICTVTSPRGMTVCGCDLFFAAFEPAVSIELYTVPAPGASTVSVGASCGANGPTLAAVTPPVLGGTAVLAGADAPTGHLGFLVLDTELRAPYALPGGCTALLNPLLTVAPLGTPTWTVNLPIPNDPTLDGVCVPTQAWWLGVAPFAVTTTGAVLLGLGT